MARWDCFKCWRTTLQITIRPLWPGRNHKELRLSYTQILQQQNCVSNLKMLKHMAYQSNCEVLGQRIPACVHGLGLPKYTMESSESLCDFLIFFLSIKIFAASRISILPWKSDSSLLFPMPCLTIHFMLPSYPLWAQSIATPIKILKKKRNHLEYHPSGRKVKVSKTCL